jgi:8-oxo-dGTP diphosphatase
MGMIRVVCGIIENDGKVFVCRRKENKSLAGFWEFPGGKVEPGEDDKEALKRELVEELEMVVEVSDLVGNSIYDYGEVEVNLLAYHCTLKRYEGVLSDHDVFDWVLPGELPSINLAPADIPIARRLALKLRD